MRRFRRCAERDLAVRAALKGAHFISVDAPLVTQYLTLSADKAGSADLRYRLLLVKKYKRYLKGKRSYVGAWCYMHAHSSIAGGIGSGGCGISPPSCCFPWDVSWERLKRSSLLARLRLFPGTGGIILSRVLETLSIRGCSQTPEELECPTLTSRDAPLAGSLSSTVTAGEDRG